MVGSKWGLEGGRERASQKHHPRICWKLAVVDRPPPDRTADSGERPSKSPSAAARPATCLARALGSCVTATMVKQRMRGKVAAGKQAATEKAAPPDDASEDVEEVRPPLGRRCRSVPSVVGVPSSRRSSRPREPPARPSTRSPLPPLSLDPAKALDALPTHQKRKVTKRAKFLEKIRVAAATKMKSPGVAKRRKGALSAASMDFAALDATLGAIATDKISAKRAKAKILRDKARVKLVNAETGRMRAVLSHPQFRSDPVAAVTNHVLAALKNAPKSAERAAAPRTVKTSKKKAVDVKEESDAVSAAAAQREVSAAARGITHRGGGDTRRPKDQLGVRYPSKAKKGAGGKKGSKRSKKRRQEEW